MQGAPEEGERWTAADAETGEVDAETHGDSSGVSLEVDDESFVLEQEKEDPVLKKCHSLVDRERTHIAVHTERAAFFSDVSSRVLSSHSSASRLARHQAFSFLWGPVLTSCR